MRKNQNKILVIRLSAFGDVAMVIPILYPICRNNPQKEFTLITSPMASQLFIDKPQNLTVKAVDTQKKYKGIGGIFALYRCLKKEKFGVVADLHDVLRSKILTLLFRLQGTKVATIDKGRKEKKSITSPQKSEFKQLETSFERYANVFTKLGITKGSEEFIPLNSVSPLPDWLRRGESDNLKWIGVAPLSKHNGKNYPLDKMRCVVESLARSGEYKIFIFGSPADALLLDKWQESDENIISLCSKRLGFGVEMTLIKELSLMISMDSANMHIATLMGTPVLSIWGATHPYTGFLGWGLNGENIIEQTNLKCRPCSVFGNKPCRFGSYECLQIAPEDIIERVKKLCE